MWPASDSGFQSVWIETVAGHTPVSAPGATTRPVAAGASVTAVVAGDAMIGSVVACALDVAGSVCAGDVEVVLTVVAGAAGRVVAFSAETVVGVLEVLGVSLRRFTITTTTTTMLMTTAAATAARYGDFLSTGGGGSGPSSTRRSRGRTLRSEGSDSVGSRGPHAPTLGGGTAIISSSASETISREAGGDAVPSIGTLDVSSRPARNGASSSPPMIAAPVAIACFG